MQVIRLPHALMILSFFLFWGAYQALIPALCLRVPLKALDPGRGIYRLRQWESAGLYRRLLLIRSWKHLLPDGAALFRRGFRKKRLASTDPGYLRLFMAESCRAELTHWLAIIPFWVFGFWAPPFVIPLMLAYAVAANAPCILAQRYNRLRIAALLARGGARLS